MRPMARHAIGKGLPLEMPSILCHLGVTTQTVVKAQDRLAMGFVARGTFKLHRSFGRESFTFELHPFVTVQA